MEMPLQHSCLGIVVSVFACWNNGFSGSMCTNLVTTKALPVSLHLHLCGVFVCVVCTEWSYQQKLSMFLCTCSLAVVIHAVCTLNFLTNHLSLHLFYILVLLCNFNCCSHAVTCDDNNSSWRRSPQNTKFTVLAA